MDGRQVFEVLQRNGMTELHHANSVTTSCSLLTLRGLGSRRCVEENGLSQTAQSSDALDKKYGVWNDVFVDMCDIHARASNVIYYGPVLFVLRAEILLGLPPGTDVLITKTNAQYWTPQDAEGSRYFKDIAEFRANVDRFNFGQAINFRNDKGLIPFGSMLVRLRVDDPQIKVDNKAVYERAVGKIVLAAEKSGVKAPIEQRKCAENCKCLDWYRRNTQFVKTMF